MFLYDFFVSRRMKTNCRPICDRHSDMYVFTLVSVFSDDVFVFCFRFYISFLSSCFVNEVSKVRTPKIVTCCVYSDQTAFIRMGGLASRAPSMLHLRKPRQWRLPPHWETPLPHYPLPADFRQPENCCYSHFSAAGKIFLQSDFGCQNLTIIL